MIKTIFVLSLTIHSIFCGCGVPAGDPSTTTKIPTEPPTTTTEKKNLEERIVPVTVLQGEHVAQENTTTTIQTTTTPIQKCKCRSIPTLFANPENTDYTEGQGCFGHSIKCTSQPLTFITNWWNNTSIRQTYLDIHTQNTTFYTDTVMHSDKSTFGHHLDLFSFLDFRCGYQNEWYIYKMPYSLSIITTANQRVNNADLPPESLPANNEVFNARVQRINCGPRDFHV
ncbi:uncharacterized protein CELE_ZC204.17 [Caenorhabditis elegans]|uniref:Uncharacterized protein n=1 Tax=Caenorhabditis elegans TaxID=6239 RepID=C8JQQ2_CAEEL|nr:Uncharacterized protein CELE_ZC204.17 [Caenorhabditis elegans]CCD63697.1 Uncharacterized protein CELE_ZC204.17 [Caenorhabditis elegans]|eukprot:NP_001254034.1 Uncharacterized protein CELE_ZC204.17 [Caenorhabditis elegans]